MQIKKMGIYESRKGKRGKEKKNCESKEKKNKNKGKRRKKLTQSGSIQDTRKKLKPRFGRKEK